MRIRLTQRRKMIEEARRKAQSAVAASILPTMQSQRKKLEHFLRRATLRKRLNKIRVDETQGNISLRKVEELFSGGQNETPNKEAWKEWERVLIAILLLSLINNADDLSEVETSVWTSRGYPQVTFDGRQLVDDYQLRTGNSLNNIGSTTLKVVQEIIANWYEKDLPFSDLMNSLEYWFSESRANAIADTEVGNLMSEVTFSMMNAYGWSNWVWDHRGEDEPCRNPIGIRGKSYQGCWELNGKVFRLGEPMPPAAAHPRCHCIATPIPPEE